MGYPTHLDIELNNTCQLHCTMCPRGLGKMSRPLGDMDLDLLMKIIEESAGKTLSVWAHVFGEPLLYPDLAWALWELKRAGFWVGISTNAVALDAAASAAILKTNIDWLILSLDSLDKETYEARRRGAVFEQTLANIDTCIDIRRAMPESQTQLIVQFIDFKDSASEVEAANLRFGDRLEGIGQVFHKWFSTYGGKVSDYSGGVKSPFAGVCEKLDRALTILWNGDVTICCHDVAGEYVIGNVRESSIHKVWNSRRRKRIHKNIRLGRLGKLDMCRNCLGA